MNARYVSSLYHKDNVFTLSQKKLSTTMYGYGCDKPAFYNCSWNGAVSKHNLRALNLLLRCIQILDSFWNEKVREWSANVWFHKIHRDLKLPDYGNTWKQTKDVCDYLFTHVISFVIRKWHTTWPGLASRIHNARWSGFHAVVSNGKQWELSRGHRQHRPEYHPGSSPGFRMP